MARRIADRPVWAITAAAFLFGAFAAHAQSVATSSRPDAVSVSIYRDPNRGADQAIDLEDLSGFALVTETRTVTLPPGRATIRFEGVASGILPESAIVIGPDAAEKNRDRRLLSQRGLLDAFTGQRATLRRTDPATGRTTEEPATVRSGGDRVIVQTAAGFEALHCTGLDQTLVFPFVPQGLSAKPTLSVLTADQPGGRVTVTLAYLASNFDWQANYVAELSKDAGSVDLFAWLTMASADRTSFVDAEANAIAGKVARVANEADDDEREEDEGEDLDFACWPYGTTTSGLPAPPPPPAIIALQRSMNAELDYSGEGLDEIVVTGSRTARREDLGDLKLYRIPMPVTVAANSQKQVAFLSKPRVKGEIIYRSRIDCCGSDSLDMLYRIRNRRADGLGEPLPGGQVALFQQAGGRRHLVGEARIEDKAVGEEVELVFGEADNVEVSVDDIDDRTSERQRLTVTNANPFPITFEAEFGDADRRYSGFGARTFRKNGKTIWRAVVPANGKARLAFKSVEIESAD